MTKVIITKCTYCGKVKPCKYIYDPFLADVADKKVYGYWCKECHNERSQDV